MIMKEGLVMKDETEAQKVERLGEEIIKKIKNKVYENFGMEWDELPADTREEIMKLIKEDLKRDIN